jgi:preprotein translocase subunit SecF
MMNRDSRKTFTEVCNIAINQCLARTLITSAKTFFAVLALFAFGDGSIFDFALTMLIGIIAGSLSSIFIATPVMLWWYGGKRPKTEEEDSRANA